MIEGDTAFFFKEVVAVVIGAAYAFIFTYLMLAAINFIAPVKVTVEQEDSGLDMSLHGEQAYDEGAL